MAHPTISIGSTGPEVTLCQQALAARGYSPGAIDGLFGPQTKAAVVHYQVDRSASPPPPHVHLGFNLPLVVDGIVGTIHGEDWTRPRSRRIRLSTTTCGFANSFSSHLRFPLLTPGLPTAFSVPIRKRP